MASRRKPPSWLPGGGLPSIEELRAQQRMRASRMSITNITATLNRSRYTIDPTTDRVRLFNRLLAAVLLYSVLAVPTQIAFAAPSGGWLALDVVVDLVFWVELVLQFRLGFRVSREEEGSKGVARQGGAPGISGAGWQRIELDGRAIAIRYLRARHSPPRAQPSLVCARASCCAVLCGADACVC